MEKLVILDRDGVINYDSPEYVKSKDEWHPIPGSLQAIKLLKDNGFLVAIATNQSGIARGLYTEKDMHDIHGKMKFLLKIAGTKVDFIAFCPHHPSERCLCRKPQPGLINQILNQFTLLPSDVIMIGDSQRDIEAATNAGCESRLVLTGNGYKTLKENPNFIKEEYVYKDLMEFAETFVKQRTKPKINV